MRALVQPVDSLGFKLEPFDWDITRAAVAHATLAGVLAALTLTILSILASRREPATKVNSAVLRMLVLSVVLLIVAAVTWGGISGQPDINQLGSLVNDGSITLAAAEAVRAQETTIGAAAVVLLTLGALCMIWGIVEVVAQTDAESRSFVSLLFAVISTLGVYETVVFSTAPMTTIWDLDFSADTASLIATVAFMILIPIGRRLPFEKIRRPELSVTVACISGSLAVASYVLGPDHLQRNHPADTWQPYVSLVLAIAATCALGVFVIASSAALSRPLPQTSELKPPLETEAQTPPDSAGLRTSPSMTSPEATNMPGRNTSVPSELDKGHAPKNDDTLEESTAGALEPLNGEVLRKRSLEVFPNAYMTVVSIIQGAALAVIVSQGVLALTASPRIEGFQFGVVLCQLLVSWLTLVTIFYMYVWYTMMVRYTPTILEALLPLALGTSEIMLATSIGYPQRWIWAAFATSIAGTLAFANSLARVTRAMFPGEETARQVWKILVVSFYACAILSVVTLVFGIIATVTSDPGLWVFWLSPFYALGIAAMIWTSERRLGTLYSKWGVHRHNWRFANLRGLN